MESLSEKEIARFSGAEEEDSSPDSEAVLSTEVRQETTADDDHSNADDEEAMNSPSQPRKKIPRGLGWLQVWALFRKNFLTKYRTPLTTFFEIFSPALMMLILVAAYILSEIEYQDASLYSTVFVDIPGPWLNLARSSAMDSNNARRSLQMRPEDARRKAHDVLHGKWNIDDLLSFRNEEQQSFGWRDDRSLQTADDDLTADDDDDIDAISDGDAFGLLEIALQQVCFYMKDLQLFICLYYTHPLSLAGQETFEWSDTSPFLFNLCVVS